MNSAHVKHKILDLKEKVAINLRCEMTESTWKRVYHHIRLPNELTLGWVEAHILLCYQRNS